MKRLIMALAALWLATGMWAQIWKVADGETRWASWENPDGRKGQGGTENRGAKGHPFDRLAAGDSVVLMHHEGAGMVSRIWLTIDDRSEEMLRGLRIRCYWDGAAVPAVDVPLGAFFCNPLFELAAFENRFFSDPEGRSFNCCIPMPFKKEARIVIANGTDRDLGHLFYDVDYLALKKWRTEVNYFHAYWHEEPLTRLGEDYLILPRQEGKGRLLGMAVGIEANPIYGDSWWGEGEIKMYIDGDTDSPTLCGTGAEDYIGTAWGLGAFAHRQQGCPIADAERGRWSWYRFHDDDPVYFRRDLKVSWQQIGGAPGETVKALYEAGVPMIPTTVDGDRFYHLMDEDKALKITEPGFPEGFVNFFRQDHVCSVAYYYVNH